MLKKIIKRLAFEATKRRKKLQHIFLNESECKLKHGNYQESNIPIINLNYLKEYYSINKRKLEIELKDADLILKDKLNLIYLDNDVDVTNWNRDYSSGYNFPVKYFGDINYIIDDESTDVKNVWEFSRLQHLVIVAKAYFLTKELKYYLHLKKQINSWHKENPIANSVNWACNMEVAIRVFNLIIIYTLVKDALLNDSSFEVKLKALIFYHNKHISRNLENYSEKRNNHYLTNLLGLLISAKFLVNKNTTKYKKQQKFSIEELEKEVEKQIYNDGVTYEISTSYQKLVFEILLYAFIFSESSFSKVTVEKLGKMFVFLKSIVNQDYTIPLIGDNDSGNIIVFEDYFNDSRSNISSLFNLAEKVLWGKGISDSALASLFNSKGSDSNKENKLNTNYPDSGYYILKNDSYRMILLCGPLSLKGQGGHSHNDQLSFVLDVMGKPLFIDTGTITYTGNKKFRNYSRQTSSHNTVSIESEEQNIIGNDLFAMNERTYSVCLKHTSSEFIGRHNGYKSSLNSVHERRVNFSNHKISILDLLLTDNKVNNIKATQNFILAKDSEVMEYNGFLVIYDNTNKLMTNLLYKHCNIKDVHVSDRYGRYFSTKKIQHNFIGTSEIIMELQ